MGFDPGVFFNTRMPGAYDATYFPAGGDPVTTVVMIDRDVEQFPGGFESNVVEKQTEIRLRYDHIRKVNKGDRITVGDESFEVDTELSNDRFEIKVSVK